MKVNKFLSEISLKKIWNKLTKHDENIDTLTSDVSSLNSNIEDVETTLSTKADSDHTHPNATTSAAGFMTAAMVTNLNDISNNKVSSYTKYTPSNYGVLKLANGMKMVWGSFATSLCSTDSDVGGYSKSVSISSYGFTDAPVVFATGQYANGMPNISIKSTTKSAIVFSSPVKISNCWVFWLAIGY